MIVKVQRALYPANAPSMIYNQSRSRTWMVKLSKEDLRKMGDDVKAYFEAKELGNEILLYERVDNQDW